MTGPVLVTGAGGFVGSHLLELLRQDGSDVVAWQRPDVRRALDVEGVRWEEMELLDRDRVARAVAEIAPSAVYHMAGSAHVAESWAHVRETYEGNVRVTHYLLDALDRLVPKPHVLIPCTAHVYAPQPRPIREDDPLRPGSPYATSKLATEMVAERAWLARQLPTIVVRAFNHTGPRQDPTYVAPRIARQIALIETGRHEPVLVMGNLKPKRDLTDVRDTVRAYVALLARGRPGVPYNVASGRAVAVGDLARAFVERARRDIRIVEDPARFRPNDPEQLVGDNSRLVADTGWQPHIPLERTVDDLLHYWRARVKAEG